jgi:hypothetical protein
MANKTFNFNVADAPPPYTNPSLTIIADSAKIIDGGLQDAVKNSQGPTKVIYTETQPERTGVISSEVTLAKDSGSATVDHMGPALLDPVTGKGYYIRVVGIETRPWRIEETQSLSGTYFPIGGNSAKFAGDRIRLDLEPDGTFNVYVNDVLEKTFTDDDPAFASYKDTVCPAAVSVYADVDGAHPIREFVAGGIQESGSPFIDFNIPDQSAPYVPDGCVVLNNPAEIANGGLVDSINDNYSSRVIYTARAPERTGNIRATIRLAVDAVTSSFTLGPALLDSSTGYGYAVYVIGAELRPYVVNTDTFLGAYLPISGNRTMVAGDDITLEMEPDGTFNVYHNDEFVKTFTDTVGLDTEATVRPAMISYTYGSTGISQSISAFLAEGLVGEGVPSPIKINSVNGDNLIRSNSAILVYCDKADTVTEVTLTRDQITYPLSIVSATTDIITVNAIDLHNTAFRPEEDISLNVTDGVDTDSITVQIQPAPGRLYVTASSIDATDGLLKSFPEAVVGDGYEGPTSIAGSVVTYRDAGPHRVIDPAVPNGTESTGYFYDVSLSKWTQIDEITNQDVVVPVDPPVGSTVPDQFNLLSSLPGILDAKQYVSGTNLNTWDLVSEPAGMTINTNGVITFDTAIAGTYSNIQFQVDSDGGTYLSNAFDWVVQDDSAALPIWGAIPNQESIIADLPSYLNCKPYVFGEDLFGWRLTGAPASMTINDNGIITYSSGPSGVVSGIQVSVSNSQGEVTSPSFSWELIDNSTPEPPVWETVPTISTQIKDLPGTFDLAGYVTSEWGEIRDWSLDKTAPSDMYINSFGRMLYFGASGDVTGFTVKVYNDVGGSSSIALTWNITENPDGYSNIVGTSFSIEV